MRRALLTGATGFVGAAIALELLERTDAQLLCIVRDHAGMADAQTRLIRSLRSAARAYGMTAVFSEIPRRCVVVSGNIELPLCSADVHRIGRVDRVFHVAASLKYSNQDAAEIMRANVEGARNALALADGLRAEFFYYLSTAYVAGLRSGIVHETPASDDFAVNNIYEASKRMAERIVLGSRGPYSIVLRPSIVVGHSRTGATLSTSGLYGLVNGLRIHQWAVRKRFGINGTKQRIRLNIDANSLVNFIPVDVVSRNAVSIALSDASTKIFHLTNEGGSTAGEATSAVFQEIGLPIPEFVTDGEDLHEHDRLLNEAISFYRCYAVNGKTFDRTNTDAVLGTAASDFPMGRRELKTFVRRFLEQRTSTGKAAIEPVGALMADAI